jgi:hypothetical protein
MAPSSGRESDSKEIHGQLHVDSGSFSEFGQDSDTDIFHRIDPDVVGGYNDEDQDNEDWVLWDENNHDIYMIPFRPLSGYKPFRSRQMPVPRDKFLYYISMQICLKK